MEALAYGTFFHEYRVTYGGRWEIVIPNLGSIGTAHLGGTDKRAVLFSRLGQLNFVDPDTPQPDVFRCSFFSSPSEGKVAYKFVFYNGFTVFAIG